MARPLKPSTIRRDKPFVYVPPVRHTVFVTVRPLQIFGESRDTSPKVFATREGAQADCDELNKNRPGLFVIREMEVH